MTPRNTELSRPTSSRVEGPSRPGADAARHRSASQRSRCSCCCRAHAPRTPRVVWAPATHPDQYKFNATIGQAADVHAHGRHLEARRYVVIEPVSGPPRGRVDRHLHRPASSRRRRSRWLPVDPGDYSIGFVAKTGRRDGAGADVRDPRQPEVPVRLQADRRQDRPLGAVVHRTTVVHAAPNASSPVVTKLDLGDERHADDATSCSCSTRSTSARPRPGTASACRSCRTTRPAGSRRARSATSTRCTRTSTSTAKTLTATLKRNGVTVFTTRVGVGKPYWPTPAGRVLHPRQAHALRQRRSTARSRSARAPARPSLTDWPGGGFVGVHGTNEPGILRATSRTAASACRTRRSCGSRG